VTGGGYEGECPCSGLLHHSLQNEVASRFLCIRRSGGVPSSVGPARWLVVRANSRKRGREMDAAAEREEEARSCRREFIAILRRRPPKIPSGDAWMRSSAAVGPAGTTRSLVDLAPPPESRIQRRRPSRRKSRGGWRGAAREEGRGDVSSLHLQHH
jgi:hypothetical protein